MTDLSVDQWVNASMSAVAFLACATFATVYHLRAFWWRSDTGWNLMGFAVSVGLLCLYTVLITIWPDGCAAAVLRSIRTAVLAVIAALMIQRTRLLLQAQREPSGD